MAKGSKSASKGTKVPSEGSSKQSLGDTRNTDSSTNGGAPTIPPYAARSRSLSWRSQWFQLSRGADQDALTASRDRAFQHKQDLIVRDGASSGFIAGYDPAGAGSPWYPLGPRNVNGRVKGLAVHPTDPDTVYAGAASGGVWKTTDGGQTWDPLWDMQESIAIGALGIAASSPSTIYAGTGEWTPGFGASYGGAGVYVSTNSGASWSRRAAVVSRRIGKLVVDPTNDQRLWVCGDAGLERSIDGGASWTTLRAGTITDIVLDPTNPNTLLIGHRFNGFYRSIDSGDSFLPLPGAPTGVAVEWPQIAIGVSGAHANNFIVIKMGVHVQVTIDGGMTFNAVTDAPSGLYAGWCDTIGCAPDDEQILLWGGVGLLRSPDGGSTWSGLAVHSDQHATVFAPSNSSVVYFANDGGVWRSDDKGATVRKVSNGLVITQFYNINFWQSLSNVIGGGAQDNATNYTTSGLTWRPVFINDGGWFLIDPTDPHIMYAESQNGYIAKSVDGGQTWIPKTAGIVGTSPFEGVLTMDPNDHLRVFYGTDRVLRSTDGLATPWTTSSQVLVGQVSSIAVAPSDSTRVYAGTNSGNLYRSDDGGNTSPWADKTGTLPGRIITSITVDPANADTLMVSVGGLSGLASSQSVYRSTLGGNAWTDVSGDLPNVVANAVALDPSDANTWYLATDTGVFRTQNAGVNWLPFDNGIPNVPVSDLVVDPAIKMLYCGTMGRGAYKLDITPGVVKPQVDLYVRDDELDTGERLPSPSGIADPQIPLPGTADFWMSPDIKVNHAPAFSPPAVFDGVDFDLTLVHQDPYRGQSNRFFVQVHNRGWQPTNNVSVRAFVADASAGLPNLPNALVPPNFDLTASPNWQPVGPAQTIPVLKPNRPVIVYWDFNLPMTTATHTCCLAVLSSPDDPFNNPSTDIVQLITMDKRVCLKNLHVVDPGMGPMGPTMMTMDFTNMSQSEGLVDIVIRPKGFVRGSIGLVAPALEFADPKEALQGIERIPLSPDDPIGQWAAHGDKEVERGLATRLAACDRSQLYEFDRTKTSELRGIKLGPGAVLPAVLVASLKNDSSRTSPPQFDVIQRLDGKVVGGSTFQFGYDRPPKGLGRPDRYVRIRIGLEELAWKPRDDDDLTFAEVTLEGDSNRTYERFLSDVRLHGCVFDGIVVEGQSLTLALVESEEDGKRREYGYRRKFEGSTASWVGEYEYIKGGGDEAIKFVYKIEVVPALTVPPAD
jgi:photosystem II stability/assembly factor-like uncharacterized protein